MANKTYTDFVASIQAQTQDIAEDSAYINYLNSAIDEINIRLGTIFPEFVDKSREPYDAIPAPWQQVIILKACAIQKLADDDWNNGQIFETNFEKLFLRFIVGFIVPDEFKGDSFGKGTTQINDWTKSLTNGVNKKKDPGFPKPFIGYRRVN